MEKICFNSVMRQDFPPLAFAVKEILPAGLFLFAAPPKGGKSLLVLDLCLSVAQGKPFLGFETTKGRAVYFAFEDNLRSLKERALKQGLDGDDLMDGKLLIVQRPVGLHSGFVAEIDRIMKENPDTILIVIDVLEYIRDKKDDTKQLLYQSDMQDMRVLREISRRYENLTILLVHHTTKLMDQNNVVNQVSGSTGLIGGTDGVWVLHKQKVTDKQATLTCIMREIESKEYLLELDVDTLKWGLVDGEASKPQKYSKPTIAEVFLEHMLAGGMKNSREVKEKAMWFEITERQLNYAKKKLRVQTIQEGTRENLQTFWKL